MKDYKKTIKDIYKKAFSLINQSIEVKRGTKKVDCKKLAIKELEAKQLLFQTLMLPKEEQDYLFNKANLENKLDEESFKLNDYLLEHKLETPNDYYGLINYYANNGYTEEDMVYVIGNTLGYQSLQEILPLIGYEDLNNYLMLNNYIDERNLPSFQMLEDTYIGKHLTNNRVEGVRR